MSYSKTEDRRTEVKNICMGVLANLHGDVEAARIIAGVENKFKNKFKKENWEKIERDLTGLEEGLKGQPGNIAWQEQYFSKLLFAVHYLDSKDKKKVHKNSSERTDQLSDSLAEVIKKMAEHKRHEDRYGEQRREKKEINPTAQAVIDAFAQGVESIKSKGKKLRADMDDLGTAAGQMMAEIKRELKEKQKVLTQAVKEAKRKVVDSPLGRAVEKGKHKAEDVAQQLGERLERGTEPVRITLLEGAQQFQQKASAVGTQVQGKVDGLAKKAKDKLEPVATTVVGGACQFADQTRNLREQVQELRSDKLAVAGFQAFKDLEKHYDTHLKKDERSHSFLGIDLKVDKGEKVKGFLNALKSAKDTGELKKMMDCFNEDKNYTNSKGEKFKFEGLKELFSTGQNITTRVFSPLIKTTTMSHIDQLSKEIDIEFNAEQESKTRPGR